MRKEVSRAGSPKAWPLHPGWQRSVSSPLQVLTCARQHLHLLRPALGKGHTPQHGLDVIAGLGQPIALHIPAEGGGLHPAGITSVHPPPTPQNSPGMVSPPPTWEHRPWTQPRALSGSPVGSPELLPLVQDVQEVVGHDVLPHQVVTDGSWKRRSSPAPSPGHPTCCPRATCWHPGSTHEPGWGCCKQQTPTPASGSSPSWGWKPRLGNPPQATASTSPHSASFMPVSTSPSFGGSTPGVSTRYMRGFSQTWDGEERGEAGLLGHAAW